MQDDPEGNSETFKSENAELPHARQSEFGEQRRDENDYEPDEPGQFGDFEETERFLFSSAADVLDGEESETQVGEPPQVTIHVDGQQGTPNLERFPASQLTTYLQDAKRPVQLTEDL